MKWDTPEHLYIEKSNDWYASVIIIVAALVAVEVMLNNFLLVALTVIGAFTFLMLARREPDVIHVEIRSTGIRAGSILYPYSSLDGFAIAEYEHEERLLLESNRHYMPLIVIPIAPQIDLDELRDTVGKYLPEKELHESLPHLLFEKIGF